MSGVTGTMIGIGVASSIAQAKMASNASKNAAKTQVAAGDKALAAQQQGYQQQRQDFSPYQQAGTAALGRLGQTAGTYTGGPPQMPQGPPPMPPQGPPQGGLASLGQPQGPPPGMPSPPSGAPVGSVPPLAGGGAPGGGGPLVQVRAPTGEIAMLPQAQAQMAVAKGATIIGQGGPPQGGMPPQGML